MRKEQGWTCINDVFSPSEGQIMAQLAAQKVHSSSNTKTMMEGLSHKAPSSLSMLNPKDLHLSIQHHIQDVSIKTSNP